MELSAHETQWLKSDGAKMLKDLGIKEGFKILDFGCGEGRYTVPSSQVVGEKGCVYSVEQQDRKISEIEDRLTEFSNPKIVKIINTNDIKATGLIGEKTIDAAYAFDVLQYIDDFDKLFSFFYSVVKPSGMVHIYPAGIPHPGDVDMDLVKSTMEKVGFTYLNSETYTMMHAVDMLDDVVYSFVKK